MKKVSLTKLATELSDNFCFIGCLSYEDRSMSIINSLNLNKVEGVILFYNKEYEKDIAKHRKQLPQDISYKELSVDDPVATTDALIEAVKSIPPNSNVVIDITTFTRESLLILLRVTNLIKHNVDSVTLLYTPANSMSNDWLSRGVSEFRSVIGYPGNISPDKPLHLVVMTGFEVERARQLIDEYEPVKISIGIGDEHESINRDLYKNNKKFVEQLSNYYLNSVENFSFSLRDPYLAKKALETHINQYDDYNTVIAPMNNKVSTIAAGLYAIENEEVQLCYAQVVEYNTQNYSQPADNCFIIPLSLSLS